MVVYSYPGLSISTTGLATSAKQDSIITLLTAIDGGIPVALGQTTMAASMPVTLASNQSTLPVSLASQPLPTGAATETTLSALNTKVTAVNTGAVTISTALPAGSAIIGKVGIDQTTPGTTNGVQVNAALPAGSNIIGNVRIDQTTPGTTNGVQINAALPAGSNIIGNMRIDQTTVGTTNGVSIAQLGATAVATGNGVVSAGVLRVALASDTSTNTNPFNVKQVGKTVVTFATNDYSSTAVTTGAYVQLVASLASAVTELEIFDSSGEALYLATGAAASEVNQLIITPGGNGRIPVSIAASTRISIKALTANAAVGRIIINFYG